MTAKHKSVFKRGAESGAFMGLYFTALYACMVGSMHFPLLSLPMLVLALGVPFFTYYLLRRSYVGGVGMLSFTDLWMEGIVIFACGSLIMAVAAFIHLRVLEPSFVADCLKQAADVLKQAGDKEMADLIKLMLEKNAVPPAADFAMEFIWLGIFSGSLLSMLVALVVRAVKVKRPKMPDSNMVNE